MENQIGIMQGRIFPDKSQILQNFPRNFWKNEFEEANKIGFSYIELLYDKDEVFENPLTSSSRIKELKDCLCFGGIKPHSICADYFTKKNLLHTESNNSWKKLRQLILFAEELLIPIIVVPFFEKNLLKNRNDLKIFLNMAEKNIFSMLNTNVCLCIETTLEASQILSVLNQTKTPIKICYDLGNAVSQNFDINQDINLLASYIGLIHVKDKKKNGETNVLMGEGDVDFFSAFKTLKNIDYKGNYTLETAIGDDPKYFAKKHLNKVKDIIKYFS